MLSWQPLSDSGAVSLTVDSALVAPWILERLGLPECPDGQRFLGLVSGERILGAVMYDDFTDASCCMHVVLAGPHAPIRRLITGAFHFPFLVWGLEKVFGKVRESNTAALRFDQKLGFRIEAVLTGVYPGGEGLAVLSMRRRDCRWLSRSGEAVQ